LNSELLGSHGFSLAKFPYLHIHSLTARSSKKLLRLPLVANLARPRWDNKIAPVGTAARRCSEPTEREVDGVANPFLEDL
jgi:hypothetical protein